MIEVENLVKMYGNHAAVDGLTFTVEKGKIVGFLGPNGAGKSTTMNMLTGYTAPTEGVIKINGINLEDDPEKAKKNIGYLPEIPPLYPDMRVREYLEFAMQLKKVPARKQKIMLEEIMTLTKITDVSERLIKHLSKGYKQRVGLANALVGYPEILILDEPTVGLDPMQIIEMRELIVSLSEKHTILLSSHIMQEISAVCDQVMIINNGQMIAVDTPDNIVKMITHSNGLHLVVKGTKDEVKSALRVISGVKDVKYDDIMEEGCIGLTMYMNENRDIREEVFHCVADAGLSLLEMSNNVATLEEAFVALTKGGSKQHAERVDRKTRRRNKAEKEQKESREALEAGEEQMAVDTGELPEEEDSGEVIGESEEKEDSGAQEEEKEDE